MGRWEDGFRARPVRYGPSIVIGHGTVDEYVVEMTEAERDALADAIATLREIAEHRPPEGDYAIEAAEAALARLDGA